MKAALIALALAAASALAFAGWLYVSFCGAGGHNLVC